MSAPVKGPFRADHVGSLLRPARLIAARDAFGKGEIGRDALTALEDECIREVVRLQEDVGLKAVSDGEFRRKVWYADFLKGFDNIEEAGRSFEISVPAGDGTATAVRLNGMRVTGPIRRSHGIQTESFEFLKGATAHVAKVCIPSPSMVHFRGGRGAIDADAYPDLDAFWADLTRAYKTEVEDLVARGLTYLQFDDTNLAYLCDENFRDAVRRVGENPDLLPATYCRVINDIVRDLPASVTVCIHLCRGNARQTGVAAGSVARGGYEPVAETLFGTLDVDGYFLEYDDARSGDFAPLRHLPAGKKVVLGMVSTKTREMETKDALKRRLDEAARFTPMERLCLSPQCGFSSGVGAKALNQDNEIAKLRLVVETAAEVWDDA